MHKLFLSLLSLSLLLSAVPTAHAQQTNLASVDLYNADVSAFPTITAPVDIFDVNGIFASGLNPEAVTVIEDGQPLPVDSLTEMSVPLQLVVAVNQGAALDARNSSGVSRFQRVAQVLAQWAQSRPPEIPDDYSLVSQAGPVINHASATDFVVGLNGFQPDFRVSIPNLQSLSIAIDTVSAQTPRLGMKRAILLITPQMDDPNLAAVVEPYIQRAVENDIHIFVWYVDADTTFTTTSAAIFNNLAIQTGGAMFQYSGVERFPDPEAYFSALRRIYTLSYTSRLKISGEHTLRVQASLPAGALTSDEQKFNIDIQPPNAFPVIPSLQITRRAPEDDPFTEVLLPASQEIEIIIEFPDGHPRPLTRTTLYVDGAIADENTAEPFHIFTWDLSTYTNSGEHQIVVEAVDMLGLSKTSMPLPIVVTVIKPPSGFSALLARYRTPITFGGILFAGLVLFFILISGRFRMPSIRAAQEARRADADPLTQSVQVVEEESVVTPSAEKTKKPRAASKKAVSDSKSRKDAKLAQEAGATFIRINAEGQPVAAVPISIYTKEIVFGTDPVQCTQIMDDASISSVHARLRQTDDAGYLLMDNNSVAGTWVNYEPIPRAGYRLAHGDMVHFGQLIYRFTLTVPPAVSTPTITVQTVEE
ncbi:MAG: FHA domain-containing protein [Anaerolineales bacterium]|nr:FHA domain-containing protein [Anaerolineales bacterium]